MRRWKRWEWARCWRSRADRVPTFRLSTQIPSTTVNFIPSLQDAYSLHQAGRLDDAEQAYRIWLQHHPDNADAMHLLGMLRHQRGDSAEALRLIRRAHELQPENAQLELSHATLLYREGDHAAAAIAYVRALALDPNLAGAHIGIGQIALMRGDDKAAEEHFRIALRAAEDGHALAGLGAIMLHRDDTEAAVRYLTRAAELVPDYSMIQYMLGQAFCRRGLFAFAEAALDKALRLQPDLHPARAWLAETLLKDGRPGEAEPHYLTLQQVPGFAVITQVGLADVARMQERDDEAIAHYRAALAIDPKLSMPTRMLAWMLSLQGRNDEVIAAYGQYLDHVPDDHDMRALQADVIEIHNRDSAPADGGQ